MDSLLQTYTRVDGTFSFDRLENARFVLFSHKNYSEKLLPLDYQDLGTIVLSKPITLNEVVVTPEIMEQYLTHQSYKIPMADLRRYNTFYHALNEIPNMQVLQSGSLFYEGSQNVILLLNGVATTANELQSLSPEDISKVNVYQTPPARFAKDGADAVIDVITKSDLTGGNGYISLEDAVLLTEGTNSAAFYYNYKRSRFSVLYDNDFQRFTKKRENEELTYTFNGVEYNKQKTGLDSWQHRDNNNVTLTYQNNKANAYLLNIKAGGSFYGNSNNMLQEVRTNHDQHYSAEKQLNTGFDNYWGNVYYEHNFDHENNGRTLMGNVRWSHYKSHYFSAYTETPLEEQSAEERMESASAYQTEYDAVIAEMQYQMKTRNWGQIRFDLFNTYKYSRYIHTENPFYLRNNTLGGFVTLNGRKKKLYYNFMLGFQHLMSDAESLSQKHTLWAPRPGATLTYVQSKKLRFRLSYSYAATLPSVADLSETNQWIDLKYVYHGNSQLKPYRTHSLAFRTTLASKYIDAVFDAGFKHSPDMLCDYFFYTDDYILETKVNLDKYYDLTGQLTTTIKPLGNTRWFIWNRLIAAKVRGEGAVYNWNGNRFQWMISNNINLDKWSFEAFYQYPGKYTEGQLVRPRGQFWSLSGAYQPMQGMTVGLTWKMPFGNYFKDSEHTVGTALLYKNTESVLHEWANCVMVNFSYNFSFGRNKNKAKPKFSNHEGDNGILER